MFCSHFNCQRKVPSMCSVTPASEMTQEGIIFLDEMYEIVETTPNFKERRNMGCKCFSEVQSDPLSM